MPESCEKRKFSVSQITLSDNASPTLCVMAAIAAGGTPVSAASAAAQAGVNATPADSSANTAPASTAESWSLSPTSSRRASFGTASTSRVASARSSIDASSMTTTSKGSGWLAS
jgi:hypothetical protein